MKRFFFILPFFALFLQACSWIVPFYVINNSNKPVMVEVTLMDLSRGIPIFDNAADPVTAYGITKKTAIDYDKPLSINKVRGADNFHYSISLPANSALEIGRLQNDRYNAHDQHFINDRVFNLRRIVIVHEDKKTEITTLNFDNHFHQINNNVVYFVESVKN